MKLSVVTQLQTHDETVIKQAFDLLQKQTINVKNFELVIFCNNESTTQEMVEYIETLKGNYKMNILLKEDIEINELKGEYVTFFDFYDKFRPNVYGLLYDAAKKKDLDFIAACLEKNPKII